MAQAADNSLRMVSEGHAGFRLQPELLLKIYDLMIQSRLLEERLIRMLKQSDGYFWIGGPGEEAFNIPLGLMVKKGQGLDYDFLHLHYRSNGVLMAMGPEVASAIDAMRQMKNTASDPFSGGRNFANHPSRKKFNVVPVTSTIETQYATAIGTAIAQRKHGGDSITIVTGGEAGTAEGDFASCLVWSTRPGQELPILIIVLNNGWGISTAARTQHGESRVSDRGNAFGIRGTTINGNDVEESFFALRDAMAYVRRERKPFLLEARVSRMYGHSSASGANFIEGEEDPLQSFESKLKAVGIIEEDDVKTMRDKYFGEFLTMSKKVREEPLPNASSIYDYIYCGQKGGAK